MLKTKPFQFFLKKHRFLIASFFVPALLMGLAYALHDIHPFGDRQILVTDFWQQYYPFLSDLWHKVREGHSLLWSWTGSGTNYLAMIAYYMGSPLNLLLILAPHAWLREMITITLLMKIGFAGSFFAAYLRYTFRRNDFSLVIFSMFYGLCAFTLGYYWNIMWFDTFALLPLVILGMEALLREDKFRVYVVALALSVFINYYIGLFICLFVAIRFVIYLATERPPVRVFLKKLGQMALYSLIALGMTAILTLPAFYALQNSYSAVNKFPKSLSLYENFIDIIGNFAPFAPPSAKEGLPNVYCGLPAILLLPVFLSAKKDKIRLAEKIAWIGVLVFLIVSCNLNVLNYIWHGFHFTNMIPYRFSFLISFVLLTVAYRAYTLLEDIGRKTLIAMAGSGVVLAVCTVLGPQEKAATIGTVVLTAVYMGCFLLFYKSRKMKLQQLSVLLGIVMLAELGYSTWIGVKTVSTSAYSTYLSKYSEVQELLSLREKKDNDFYRTEMAAYYTTNDPSLYGYDGISIFSSTVNADTTRFIKAIGLPAREAGNRYCYAETSPLTNALINMRYLITRNGAIADGKTFWQETGRSGDAVLFENQRYLPMGFVVGDGVLEFSTEDVGENPFLFQNQLFQRLAGVEGDLFTLVDMIHVGHVGYDVYRQDWGKYEYVKQEDAEEGHVKWNYQLPDDGIYYAYVDMSKTSKVKVSLNEVVQRTHDYKNPYIFCLGNYTKDELVSLTMDVEEGTEKGNLRIYVAKLDTALFDDGYERLRDEPLQLTHFSDTAVAGTVTALQEGLLYASIPYEKGWSAYVDGEEAEIHTVLGSMAAVYVPEGEHFVEFRIVPAGFRLGAAASIGCLIVFAGLIWLARKRRS
ncbi:YfhO family protein [Ruminococcaceae bacterium OttesenSCG-928-L11]|nr:YfhO family protein [Ruminococcaceae bacterium OttesenSCG-928-L11]